VRVKVRNAASLAFIAVSVDDVAKRAYEIYMDRGCGDGFDREDWLRAECELNGAPTHPAEVSATQVKGTMKHA
jgi:hypothetical protein